MASYRCSILLILLLVVIFDKANARVKRRLKHDLETDQTQADAAIPTDQTLQDQQPTTDYEEYGPEYEEYYEEDDKKRTYSLSLLEVCMSVQTFLIMVYLGLHLL